MACPVHSAKAQARSLYRQLHRQLELFPVEHVRDVYKPYFRQMLRPAVNQPAPLPKDSTSNPTATVKHALRRAKIELNHLKAANAGHKHAFERTLAIAFGRRGWVRWKLLNVRLFNDGTIYKTSGEPPVSLSATSPLPDHFPPVLRPLLPKAPAPQLRMTLKGKLSAESPRVKAKHAAAAFQHLLKGLNVPIVLPLEPGGPRTGWEGKGVLEALRDLAMPEGLPVDRRPLPPRGSRPQDWDTAAYLGEASNALHPAKVKKPQPGYERPPARNTRQNPKTWTRPHTLSPRFIRRAARRIWESLPPALSFVDGQWRAERATGKGKGKRQRRRKAVEKLGALSGHGGQEKVADGPAAKA